MNLLGRTASTNTNAKPAIVACGLSKQYGRHRAVDGIDFSVPKGTTLALIGHNGAGNSTLFKTVLGFLKPAAGRLAIVGAAPGSSRS